ncbi:MAG: hypothetical protein JSS91_11480 [Bacteroidetes bacterium]|nr:hypothetical protein [Bacteroidota bacterium]
MSISTISVNSVKKLIFLLPYLLISFSINAQIKVYERPSDTDLSDKGLYFSSETRRKIMLNGQWEASFTEGKNFSSFIVPLAFDFSGNSIFRKKFVMDAETVKNNSFIFVAEGICYESEIKINNNFVANHAGGFTPVVVPLSDGIISEQNEITVNINSSLNFKNTIPLSDQINYSRVYGGINKDIYLIAVPKIFVFSNFIRYRIDNLLSLKLTNKIEIKSTFINELADSVKSGEFEVKSSLTRKSTGEVSSVSEPVKFKIDDNNTVKLENSVSLNNPVLWSPETPEVYILKTVITDLSGKIIDESITETGFNDITKSNNQIFQSGKQISIKGINYYEDMPGFASALEYKEVEKDLQNIKALGFNAVRVPGKTAHPYVVNICSRMGLFLFQDIPLNEISSGYFENENFTNSVLDHLTEIIERDRNAPCIFAWGLGNDLDVTGKPAFDYLKSAAAIVDSVNKRLTYYTSRAYTSDICSELADLIGINFYGNNLNEIKKTVTDITDRAKPVSNRKNNSLFVSYYGVNIQNGNSNGFSDIRSQEYQIKFYKELYPSVSRLFPGSFISSYADWNSENPLDYPLDADKFLQTNGIHTFNREQKMSTNFIKRLLNNEDLPRIQEGNFIPEFPYVFIILGILVMLIFTFFLNKDRKFRSSILRCLYKPTYFFSLVKDQMIISRGYNILLTISISIGTALYFSSILYFLRGSNSFDMLLAKIFTNNSAKIYFSDIVNNKFYLLSSISLLDIILTFLTAFFIYFISFYVKGKVFFKNIYTICIWSTLPMLVFLLIGTILYKLSESNPAYIKLSVWLFVILFILSLNRLIIGIKSLFDIRTGKVYFYGIMIIFIFTALAFSYFYFFTGAVETYELLTNLNNF